MGLYQKSIKIISNIIFMSIIVMLIIAFVHDNTSNEAPIGSFETIDFNENWILEKEGKSETITLPYSSPDSYKKTVTIKNTLPDTIKDGMELTYRSDLSDIEIYVGDEKRVEFGEKSVSYVGYYPPSAYEFVSLKEEDAGKEIRIVSLVKKKNANFEKVTIGFGNNGWTNIIVNNIAEFAEAILMVGIGFLAIIFYFFMSKKVKINRSVLFLGQTVVMLGVWILSESRLRQLVFQTPSLTQVFCYLSLEILAVYVLFYFDEIQNKKYHKLYIVLQSLNLGQLLINIILAGAGIAELHDTLRLSHIWIGATFIPSVFCIAKDLQTGRIKKYYISAIGMFIFLLTTLGELVSYYVTSAQTLGVYLCIGLIALLVATVLQTLVDVYQTEKKSRMHVEKSTMATIETIASAIDARDKYTGGHSERVAYYAECLSKKVAEEYNFSEKDTKRIHYVALMHDIGKIGIEDSILNKADKLTDEEFITMKKHAEIGDDLLQEIDTIEGLSEGVRHHHERYDGKGYPDGLAGEEIPLIARILCIADCFDAMTSDRVYRKRLSDEVVREELERCAGSQFDPKLIIAFCELLDSGELTVQPQKMYRKRK